VCVCSNIFCKFTGAQHIDSIWREIQGNTLRYKIRSDYVIEYLSEYLFKRAYSRLERIENFFDIIAEMYPPISTSKDQSETSSDESSMSTT